MRLIDEDVLKAALVPLWNCHDDSDFANKDVWRELENAPTVDAVPVIRCKDCKYSYAMITAKSKDGQERWMRFCDKHKNWYPKDDWFCKDGEREKE